MKSMLSLLGALLILGPALAREEQDTPNDKTEAKIAAIQKSLAETQIETKGLPGGTTLGTFLAALEADLAKKKIAIRLDKAAFGKDLPKLAGAKVHLGTLPGKIWLHTLLPKALRQLPDGLQADYAIRGDGVLITRPKLATHSLTYDVRDFVKQMPRLVSLFPTQGAAVEKDARSTDGPDLLVRLLMKSVDLSPWETVEVLNGVQVRVRASASRHQEVASLIMALRRLNEISVVMNSRLYEVDRAFYKKNIAPLHAKDKEKSGRPGILAIDKLLLDKITQQKLLLRSEDVKLQPDQKATFLSRQSAFRYVLKPAKQKTDKARLGAGLAGVSFEVYPGISRDRRFLHLRIVQKVVQLAGIDKVKKWDLETLKLVEVESPNLQKRSFEATVYLPDGNPILMPIDYRPAGKENENKVWLLVARPFIWIEEEAKELQKQGRPLSPDDIWKSDVSDEKP